MAVTQQVEEQEAVTAPRKAPRAARLPGAAWTSPAQFARSLPMIRLLAEIWAIPQVSKVGGLVDETGTYIRVLMDGEDKAAEARIYQAERDYLNGTAFHNFDLHVTQLHRVPERRRAAVLAGFATILER